MGLAITQDEIPRPIVQGHERSAQTQGLEHFGRMLCPIHSCRLPWAFPSEESNPQRANVSWCEWGSQRYKIREMSLIQRVVVVAYNLFEADPPEEALLYSLRFPGHSSFCGCATCLSWQAPCQTFHYTRVCGGFCHRHHCATFANMFRIRFNPTDCTVHERGVLFPLWIGKQT